MTTTFTMIYFAWLWITNYTSWITISIVTSITGMTSTKPLMPLLKSFRALLQEHISLFGEGVLKAPATDKGYWSTANRRELTNLKIKADGLDLIP